MHLAHLKINNEPDYAWKRHKANEKQNKLLCVQNGTLEDFCAMLYCALFIVATNIKENHLSFTLGFKEYNSYNLQFHTKVDNLYSQLNAIYDILSFYQPEIIKKSVRFPEYFIFDQYSLPFLFPSARDRISTKLVFKDILIRNGMGIEQIEEIYSALNVKASK